MKKNTLVLSVFLSVLFLDQLTKHIITRTLSFSESVPVIGNIFHLTFVTNTGSAFGLFRGINMFFILLTLAVCAAVVYQLIKLREKEKKTQFALAMLLGGAAGNLIDRIIHGHVIDFLDFRIWPVFNIADSAITISVIILVILLWKK
jgi:signal peptidase II